MHGDPIDAPSSLAAKHSKKVKPSLWLFVKRVGSRTVTFGAVGLALGFGIEKGYISEIF